jgi:flagellar hook-basal body complex protein FliE
MNAPDAIAAIGGSTQVSPLATAVAPCAERQPAGAATVTFGDVLAQGIETVEARVDRANELVRAFAVDDSIPVHEVTIALEEARIAVELAMQVRSRIVEGYREIMNMQL